MSVSFHPAVSQVALIEPEVLGLTDHDAANRLIGVVATSDGPLPSWAWPPRSWPTAPR